MSETQAQIQQWQPGAQAVDLAQFDRGRFNVLMPTQQTARINPFQVASVTVVQLDPDERGGDVYHNQVFCGRGEVALSKNGLTKLARAAGLEYVPQMSGRMDDNTDLGYRSFRAVYRLRTPSGGYEYFEGNKEVDTRAGGAVEASVRKAASKKEFGSAAARDAYVTTEIARAREHALSNAETKAKLRAIREALAIKSKYAQADLARPFVVPRLDFCPDYSDPSVRSTMLALATGAQGALYGGAPALPALPAGDPGYQGTAKPPSGIPAGAVVYRSSARDDEEEVEGQMTFDDIPPHDPNTGEVVDPLLDLLLAIESADSRGLGDIIGKCNAAMHDGRYTADQWQRITAAAGQRKAQLSRAAA